MLLVDEVLKKLQETDSTLPENDRSKNAFLAKRRSLDRPAYFVETNETETFAGRVGPVETAD